MKTPVPICVQKFHPNEEVHNLIQKKISLNPSLKAVFQNGVLWGKGDTITVSFENNGNQYPCGGLVQWYDLKTIQSSLTAAQLDIENRARAQPTFVDAVKLIVSELVQPVVPEITIKFVDYGGNVRVNFDPEKGSNSVVGTACKESSLGPTMNLGWMDVGTIVHEFSHVLGMLHEHQNPNGKPIQWNKEAVYEWAQETQGWDRQKTDDNILNTYNTNEITGSDFDPDSVMLYFFPASLTTNGYSPKQNLRYSQTDVQWLGKYYGKDVPQSPIQRPSSSLNINNKDLFQNITCVFSITPVKIAVITISVLLALYLIYNIGMKIYAKRKK